MRGAFLVLMGMLAATGCATAERAEERTAPEVFAYPAPEVAADLTVLETLMQSQRFHRFVALTQMSGHFTTLRDAATLVVLAPTDDAFDAMPRDEYLALLADKDRLHRLIDAHVLAAGAYRSDTHPLRHVDRTLVAQRDLRCANGIVLVIDELRPPRPVRADANLPIATVPR